MLTHSVFMSHNLGTPEESIVWLTVKMKDFKSEAGYQWGCLISFLFKCVWHSIAFLEAFHWRSSSNTCDVLMSRMFAIFLPTFYNKAYEWQWNKLHVSK